MTRNLSRWSGDSPVDWHESKIAIPEHIPLTGPDENRRAEQGEQRARYGIDRSEYQGAPPANAAVPEPRAYQHTEQRAGGESRDVLAPDRHAEAGAGDSDRRHLAPESC